MFSRISQAAQKSFHVWEKYEHYFGGVALSVGFCFDLIFANRPDSAWDNILLLLYLCIAGGLIIALNIRSVLKQHDEHQVEPFLLLIILQFLFGNLSSNLLVLYGHSGTFAASALFVGILLMMLIGNEFLKTRYGQLRFNIAVYYMLVFTYLMIAVPTFVFHDIGPLVFLAAGLISLVYISAFLWVVYSLILRGRYRRRHLLEVGVYVAGIFFVFNIFYFLGVIPPVPLSLKEIGIYHSVSRDASGDYQATLEPAPWFAFWRATNSTYHLTSGQPAYCFSSVFAPTGLSTPIDHNWEKYNETTHKWVTQATVSFSINGGSARGYRGFSTKTLSSGQWRCDVETQNHQLIGRTTFEAAQAAVAPTLLAKTL